MKRKIRLSLENLAVDSFDTAADDEKNAGTVRGHAATEFPCNFSRGTCFQSCAMTNGYQYCIDPYC